MTKTGKGHIPIWVMHPVRSTSDMFQYVEDRRGIPLAIRLWMRSARFSAVCIYGIIVITLSKGIFLILGTNSILANAYTALITGLFLYLESIVSSFPKWDIFVPLGFHLFKWTITQEKEITP